MKKILSAMLAMALLIGMSVSADEADLGAASSGGSLSIGDEIKAAALYAPTGTITASARVSGKSIMVSGVVRLGADKRVAVLVTDGAGEVLYVNQQLSGAGGAYSFTFEMPDGTPSGTYTVTAGCEDDGGAAVTTFEYVEDRITAAVETSGRLIAVSGTVKLGFGKRVAVLVTDSAGEVLYVNQQLSGAGGAYSFTFEMPDGTPSGTYTVTAGCEDDGGAAVAAFEYSETDTPIDLTAEITFRSAADNTIITQIQQGEIRGEVKLTNLNDTSKEAFMLMTLKKKPDSSTLGMVMLPVQIAANASETLTGTLEIPPEYQDYLIEIMVWDSFLSKSLIYKTQLN